jgi:hypothetical protein
MKIKVSRSQGFNLTNLSATKLIMAATRSLGVHCYLQTDVNGLGFIDNDGSHVAALPGKLQMNSWNTVKLRLDFGNNLNTSNNGKDDDYATVWLNGALVYSGNFNSIEGCHASAQNDGTVALSDEMKFSGGPCYLDDLSVWPDVEVTEWRRPYVRTDANTVALFHFDEKWGTATYGGGSNSAVQYPAVLTTGGAAPAWQTSLNTLDYAIAFNGSGSYAQVNSSDFKVI